MKQKNSLLSKMWTVPENISVLQKEDDTLKPLFAKVVGETKGSCVGRQSFIVENYVLYAVDNDHKCLVVPVSCRSLVLHTHSPMVWAPWPS